MREVRVGVVDDHPIVREGVVRLLEREADMTVVGEAGSAAEAMALVRSNPPDVLLVDLNLGRSSGLDLIRQVRTERPSVRMLVLSMYDEQVYAARTVAVGAMGYVQKDRVGEDVIRAVRRIASGRPALSEAVQQQMLAGGLPSDSDSAAGPHAVLSDRELQVFHAVARGETNREIAETLSISIKTVYKHVERIKDKLRLGSSRQLVHYAADWQARRDGARVPD